ncbi:hypothetical protein M378DRAFT_18373, partial [Amanita muscaria Koide BX008]
MPPRGERDKVDSSLIISTARISQPSKRSRGLDYPESTVMTNKEEDPNPKNIVLLGKNTEETIGRVNAEGGKNYYQLSELVSSQRRPGGFDLIGKNMEEMIGHVNAEDVAAKKKSSLARLQPVGEAVNEDGTLKDAAEICWVHSPSDLSPPPVQHLFDEESDHEVVIKKRRLFKKADSVHSAGNTIHVANPGEVDEDRNDIEDTQNQSDQNRVDKDAQEEASDCESEGQEDEGTANYWEKKQTEGIRKPKRKRGATRDLELCFAKDVCAIDGKEKAGEYCKLCMARGVKKRHCFFTGNATALRTHITRFHYGEYLALCKTKNYTPKAHPPSGWEQDKDQKTLDVFTVKKPRPAPPVTKAGLKEFLLELVIDGNLSFRFVERPAFHRLMLYLNPKLKDQDIPKRTCISNAVSDKIHKLDEIDMNLTADIPSLISVIFDGWSSKRRRAYSSISIQYIYSPPNDPYDWSLRSHLIAFNHT